MQLLTCRQMTALQPRLPRVLRSLLRLDPHPRKQLRNSRVPPCLLLLMPEMGALVLVGLAIDLLRKKIGRDNTRWVSRFKDSPTPDPRDANPSPFIYLVSSYARPSFAIKHGKTTLVVWLALLVRRRRERGHGVRA